MRALLLLLACLLSPQAPAAWAFGACGAFTTVTAATINAPFPTGITAGQLLAVNYYVRTDDDIVIPSGYTSLVAQSGTRVGIFGREAVGSETGNLTISLTITDAQIFAQICRFTTGTTGWTIASQIHASNTVFSSAVVDVPTPDLTISQNNTLVLVGGGANDYLTPYTAPGGFTEIGDGGAPDPDYTSGSFAYQIQTTATNISVAAFDSASAGTAHNSRAHIISLLAPAVGGGGGASASPFGGPIR